MFDRFERPIKIICLAMAVLLAWQLASLILQGNPLAHLKIPALPALPGTSLQPAKLAQKETNMAVAKKSGANIMIDTNAASGTNVVAGTNAMAASTNSPATGETGKTNIGSGPQRGNLQGASQAGVMGGRLSGRMPQMMGGGMSGGMKKIELSPEVQTRVARIIDSEIFGPVIRPMPVALIGIADQEAYIRATNGQSGPVKIGGEMGGVKLLRIGINRVLVEQDGEQKELTLFGGIGGESLMPKQVSVPTNSAPANPAFSFKQKETQ